MGIFEFYKNKNHHILFNNSYTEKINRIETDAYVKLMNLLDIIENELYQYLEQNLVFLTNSGISFNILNNIRSMIFNRFYKEYAYIVDINLLNAITSTILRGIINNYNSQIEIANLILDQHYTIAEYKIFVMMNIAKITIHHALNNIHDFTNAIIKKDIKKNVATYCIQKNLKFVITNPNYQLCKNRINYEYENMEQELNKNT